jgi:hypothetical protein
VWNRSELAAQLSHTTVYAIMDGRARYAPDEALVMSVSDTLEEALQEKALYGDAVVMECTEDEAGALTCVGLVG